MPAPYRYTSPVPKNEATGQVAAAYNQIAADFVLIDGPLMSLSPAPELLAATWALLREAQLAGPAPRVNKEVIGAAVSAANGCQFCVDAHTMIIHATGAHQLAETIWRGKVPSNPELAALVEWGKAMAKPGRTALRSPTPEEWRAEYLGTALVTHFINRLVSSLLNERVLPGRLQESSFVRRLGGHALGRSVRLQLFPGASLSLLGDRPSCPPVWAGASPIGVAYAALQAAAGAGGALLSAPAWGLVKATVAGSPDAIPERELSELQDSLPDEERHGAKLALLAALAPKRIADTDVAAWRATHPADADLIRLIAFGAFTAVERIDAFLAPRPRSEPAATVDGCHSPAA